VTASVADLQRVLGQHYRVEREVGAGGMATVYLAYDLKHDRRVAIKVLRPELSAIVGGERFLKEIRTTANLQHPHILPLHDSGAAEGAVYYVMPFVEGESLRQRLVREKQLPVEDAVRIAREVASALDYAHRHGIVHRDIKPENILLHDGTALVVDFGIALAMSRSDGATRMTETGMSLGTPNYMSPEQAMGEREITPKSDVYALGAVLYEMLVGEPPFTGPTPQAIFARVLTDEPRSLTAQRKTIPPHVETAVITALSKLPADRYATAAQFSEALAAFSATTPRGVPSARPTTRLARIVGFTAAALLFLSLGAALARFMTPPRPETPAARFSISLPPEFRLTGAPVPTVALSPDGSTIVYVGDGVRGQQLFLRRLDDFTITALPSTEGASAPLFTPDGAWITFAAGNTGKKVALSGGSAVNLGLPAVLAALPAGGDDYIVTNANGVMGTLRSGGVFQPIASPDSTEIGLGATDVLPDGRILAIALTEGLTGPVWLINPKSGARTLVTRERAGWAAFYDGFVAWVQATGTLVAAPWDDRLGSLGSTPQVIATNVRINPGAPPQVAFSDNGSLVYTPARLSELVQVDRAGRAEVLSSVPRRYHNPRVSPDGSRILLDIFDEVRDLWLFQIRDATLSRLTFDSDGHDPLWMPDGRSVLYSRSRTNTVGVSRRRVDGSTESDSILHQGAQITAHSVTPDGATAVVSELGALGDFNLLRLSLTDRKVVPILRTNFNEMFPAISPDGRWLAYATDESGQSEVYVRPLADAAGRILVSQNGGTEAVWSRNGRELFYRSVHEPTLMAAVIQTRPELRVVSRNKLFDVTDYESAAPHANYDVTPDGQFIFVRNPRVSELVYVQNWTELIRRRTTTR
jgi:Tol biopolymer transport system component/tRNA A-37 threonylcarbamoyl transferase component Bud32